MLRHLDKYFVTKPQTKVTKHCFCVLFICRRFSTNRFKRAELCNRELMPKPRMTFSGYGSIFFCLSMILQICVLHHINFECIAIDRIFLHSVNLLHLQYL